MDHSEKDISTFIDNVARLAAAYVIEFLQTEIFAHMPEMDDEEIISLSKGQLTDVITTGSAIVATKLHNLFDIDKISKLPSITMH